MFRNRPVSLALVGLFIWLTACSSYSQIGLAEVADHGKVRVTLTDGERETVRDPWIEADSIRGREAVFALDQVTKLEAVGTNVAGTVFTVFGAVVLAGAIFAFIWCSTHECVSGPLENSL